MTLHAALDPARDAVRAMPGAGSFEPEADARRMRQRDERAPLSAGAVMYRGWCEDAAGWA